MSICRLKDSYVISLELQIALEAVLTPILQVKKLRLRDDQSCMAGRSQYLNPGSLTPDVSESQDSTFPLLMKTHHCDW